MECAATSQPQKGKAVGVLFMLGWSFGSGVIVTRNISSVSCFLTSTPPAKFVYLLLFL